MHDSTGNYDSSAVRVHAIPKFNTESHACVITHTQDPNDACEDVYARSGVRVCVDREDGGLPGAVGVCGRTTRELRGSRLARAPSTAPRTRCAVRRSRWQELYGLVL